MFWDKVAPAYDLFETVYNAKVYRNTGERVASEISDNDTVLECACGTGAITIPVAKVCRRIYATDMAVGMLKKLAGNNKLVGLLSHREELIEQIDRKIYVIPDDEKGSTVKVDPGY